MAKRADAYLDTSAFIAFLDRSDTYHSVFRRLFAQPPSVITTTLVVAEGHAWFLRRYDRTRALQFISFIEDFGPLDILPVTQAEQTAASRLLRKFADQDLTMTDAMGLHFMQEYRVKSCWSTDFHMRLTGVPLAIEQ